MLRVDFSDFIRKKWFFCDEKSHFFIDNVKNWKKKLEKANTTFVSWELKMIETQKSNSIFIILHLFARNYCLLYFLRFVCIGIEIPKNCRRWLRKSLRFFSHFQNNMQISFQIYICASCQKKITFVQSGSIACR